MKGTHEANEQIKAAFQNFNQEDLHAFDHLARGATDKMLKQGMSAKEAMGISGSYLENIYTQAYNLYNTGKYADAVHLFRMLVLLNSMEPKYMMGLAASFHLLKSYTEAIQNYTMCSVLDPENPIPHYHCADCSIQMKEYLSAMIYLELTIQCCGNKQEYAKMKERALLNLESIKKEIAAHPVDCAPSAEVEVEEEKEEER